MAEFKFACAQCGQHIQCDTSYAGMQIDCPVCQQSIVVPQPPRAAASAAPSAAAPLVIKKSRTLQKVLIIAALVLVLAALVIGGSWGYSKYKRHYLREHLPIGLVGLWSGDENDLSGGMNAKLNDIAFAAGKSGKAFSFNGTSSSVKIPASPSLDVGTGSGFTVMAWIKPTDVTQDHPLFEWSDSNYWGVHLHIAPGQPTVGSSGPAGPGQLYANVVDSYGGWHPLGSAMDAVTANVFQHVALTYDKVSGVATIYCNGQVVSQRKLGSFNTRTSARDLYLGRRPAPSDEVSTFAGLMDDAALFNRALSAEEIQKIYAAQK